MSKTQAKPEAPPDATTIADAKPEAPLDATTIADADAVAIDAQTGNISAKTVHGRALIDVPAFGLACGEFGDIPDADAGNLIASGQFDDRATPAEA